MFGCSRNVTQTRFPSVTGVELAKLLRLCFFSSGHLTTVFCQTIAPSPRLTQINSRSPVDSMHEVRKMRSPQTTGEEWPCPGISDFQTRFSLSDQVRGNALFSVETPSRRGPRQAGQLSPRAAVDVNSRPITMMRMRTSGVPPETLAAFSEPSSYRAQIARQLSVSVEA